MVHTCGGRMHSYAWETFSTQQKESGCAFWHTHFFNTFFWVIFSGKVVGSNRSVNAIAIPTDHIGRTSTRLCKQSLARYKRPIPTTWLRLLAIPRSTSPMPTSQTEGHRWCFAKRSWSIPFGRMEPIVPIQPWNLDIGKAQWTPWPELPMKVPCWNLIMPELSKPMLMELLRSAWNATEIPEQERG